jgi:CDGSH-type Zn-finger protein
MGVMVIASYRPKPGKAGELLALTRSHLPVLVKEGLAEAGLRLCGRAKDGTLVEVFVWKSAEAIEAAHKNPAVGALWRQFGQIAEFVMAKDLVEAGTLFSEFEWLPVDEPPKIAGTAPIGVDVEAGRTYFWCACGGSKTQPFCDGTHKGTTFSPVKWTALESKRMSFCACKRTHGAPLCDGTHKSVAAGAM